MANPFRSEADAYRFLLLTIGYFGAIVIGSLVFGRWVGLAVFIALTVVAAGWLLRRRREPATRVEVAHRPHAERRILVVANETVGGSTLREEVARQAAAGDSRVRVVCPALNTPLRHWVSDEDPARAAAQRRLDESLARLRSDGLEVEGCVGDSEPLQALEDEVRTFDPDEIVISTHPAGRSHWLERGVVEAARQRFDVPITHVVVDLEAELQI
jgi:membrane protein implicated in regulation of membrane protease activity